MIELAWPDNIIPMPQPQGKSNEWYTPARYVEAARQVMGGIDLDPASCAIANQTVKATRCYTIEDDGLAQEWYGRVWLNPPFSAEQLVNPIRFWVRKLLDEHEQGNVLQATLLVTAATERNWFQPLWEHPVCFFNHQLVYLNIGTHKRHGDCIVYLGPHEQKFIDVFSQFGRIAKAIDTPRKHPVTLSLWGDL